MSTLENSLRCLRHPITWLSIGLLVINDHVLKVLVPSWLTGKLSDFAGLYFFPFLLAVAFGLVIRRAPIKTIGALAFGITALWFTLIKTTIWGNGMTEEFVSRLLGVPVQIVLDPTDLIALVSLFPAWRLWNRQKQTQPTRLGWVALGVASLAVLATTPPPPLPVVKRLVSSENIVYARLDQQSYYGGSTLNVPYASSSDGGFTWSSQSAQTVPSGIDSERGEQFVLCHPTDSKLCFRLGNEQVDQSNDGGTTWQVGWNIPLGRKVYMDRIHCGLLGCTKTINMGPYDMVFVRQGDGYALDVALGNEGVLVRTADGKWNRFAVLAAEPSPYAAQNISGVFSVAFIETGFLALLGFLEFPVFSIIAWIILLSNPASVQDPKHSRRWALKPFLLPVALFLVSCVLTEALTMGLSMFLFSSGNNLGQINDMVYTLGGIILLLLAIASVVGFFISWARVAQLSANRRVVWQAVGLGLLGSFLGPPLAWGVWVLWAFNIIPLIEISNLACLVLPLGSLLLALLGLTMIRRHAIPKSIAP